MSGPEPPGANRLAKSLAALLRKSRSSGDPESMVLHNGLHVQVETVHEDVLRLWRKAGHPSPDEAATVATAVGWAVYDADWESTEGTRYLVVRQRPEVEDDHPDDVPPWEDRPPVVLSGVLFAVPEPHPYPEVAQRLRRSYTPPRGRFMCHRDELSAAEQSEFAWFVLDRLPKAEKRHEHALTHYAQRVLGLRQLLHWRGLTREQARTVMRACAAQYPLARPERP
ncbi:hypothetical protein [Deinococcus multiflagellatus]|uniref:Uncharacterized protein n=1 Tax=Deinococcus multiflagellatus TaxID=1656887 RepID=A0ABW1ZT61_9DEIO|nr:hypothetical protein [Deinococcus multiflagellatus]MBZ9715314.1 hypothetical protein [Deinococcus multiflagellatus]